MSSGSGRYVTWLGSAVMQSPASDCIWVPVPPHAGVATGPVNSGWAISVGTS